MLKQGVIRVEAWAPYASSLSVFYDFFCILPTRSDMVRNAHIRTAVLVAVASALLICFGAIASQHLNLATAIALYLFITLAIANQAGFLAASAVSVVATLCLDFFFAPPFLSFRVDHAQDLIALATFEGISLVVSNLSHKARLRQRLLEQQRTEQQALYELCRDMLLLDWKQSPDQQLCTLIMRSFPLKGVALWNAYEDTLSCQGDAQNAEAAIKAVFFNERNYDDYSNGTSFRILFFGTRAVGALMLCGHSIDSLTINSIASITAMVIERARSLTLEMNAEAERHSEQLRSAVLDGLAHAFKTPLTTITLASSGLLALEDFNAFESKLVTLINQEATRLSDLTSRLLNTSRLERSQFVLHKKATDIRELMQRVLDECALQLSSRKVDLVLTPEVKTIRCDPQVLTLGLVQILDNAAKYGSQNSRLLISGQGQASEIVLRIHNEGSYIPPAERKRVFTRFYRSPTVEHRAPGTGLGLSVAKKAVEAHGGKISIESDAQTGTTFVISIPSSTERAI